jgi:hypothetical protein
MEEFGLERVRKLLQNAPAGSAEDLCALILQSVGAFGVEIPPCDDRTALALVRTV